MATRLPFREIWLCDFEYQYVEGEGITAVHCMVAREVRTGRWIRRWADDLTRPPFELGADALFVSFASAAEMGCFLKLGWPRPVHILDLYAEFRNFTNGARTYGSGLLDALKFFDETAMASVEKEEMRALAIRGGPFMAKERQALVSYCTEDVKALERLLPHIECAVLEREGHDSGTNLAHALIRGRYGYSVAIVEANGVPIDASLMARVRHRWPQIRSNLVRSVDRDYRVYDGEHFNLERFERYLERIGLIRGWPRTPTGRLAIDEETFREQSKIRPELNALRELRYTLLNMRLEDLAVGSDGRHRYQARPFASRTGRNQPSSTKFIFGPAKWTRAFITPPPGRCIAYLDWSAQEYGIAASLSGDRNMQADYQIDPYLEFAKRIGAAPKAATKATHARVRDQFKVIALATNYGMGARALAEATGLPVDTVRRILRGHREHYADFWRWSDDLIDRMQTLGRLETPLGWGLVGPLENTRAARNFPMQGAGADLLRVAVNMLVDAGVEVLAMVHDALLVMAPQEEATERFALAARLMGNASEHVLGGFRIRVGGTEPGGWICHGEGFSDARARRCSPRSASCSRGPTKHRVGRVGRTDPGDRWRLCHCSKKVRGSGTGGSNSTLVIHCGGSSWTHPSHFSLICKKVDGRP